MNKYKKIIPLIFGLAIVSLISLVVLQYIWLKDAMMIQDYKHNHNLKLVSEDVSENLMIILAKNNETDINRIDIDNPQVQDSLFTKISQIPTSTIDSLINASLTKHNINGAYEFILYNGTTTIQHSSNIERKLSEYAHYSTLDHKKKYILYLYIEDNGDFISLKNWKLLVFIALFMLLIFFAFYISLKTLLEQKKISDVTNDFINNMTHEFKTPISVINLVASTIENPKIIDDHDAIKMYTEMIKEECKKMDNQVQRILEVAKYSEEGLQITTKSIDINKIVIDLSKKYKLKLSEINGEFNTEINALQAKVMADEMHISNMFNSLFDNAFKYRKANGQLIIQIKTENIDNKLHITFTDNGIGMSRDQVKHSFKEFYRASTGNLHNVKGFGLGLTYIKSVVDAHCGKISITSTISKGTSVNIILNLD